MSLPCSMSQLRRVRFLGAALFLAASLASAQSASSHDQPLAAGYSSSQSGPLLLAEAALPNAPDPRASASPSAGADQYGGGGRMHGLFHHLTFQVGGAFNAPISSSVTYGGNFTLGGGFRVNRRFSTFIDYQFLDDKLPGALIAETNGQATGGHAHIWSFTIDPVVDLLPKATNDFYVTGGGGFYRKVTSFTFPEPQEFCSYFYCGVGYAPGTVGHFSSNQGGFNIGGGYQRRMGGMYGDSNTTLFAEVRYLDVLSPAIIGQSPNNLPPVTIDADTKVIPVSLGIRW